MQNRENLLDCLKTRSLHTRKNFNIKITYIANFNQDLLQRNSFKKQI